MGTQEMLLILFAMAPIAAVLGLIFYYILTKHRERIRIIDAGGDPQQFEKATNTNINFLAASIIIFGLSIGMALSSFIDELTLYRYTITSYVITGICLSISLYIVHYLHQKNRKK